MYDTETFMVLWTIGTFVFSAGFGWAGIKIGQRQMAEAIRETKEDVKSLSARINENEKAYMTKADCEHERNDCAAHRNYHEGVIIAKLEELHQCTKALSDKLSVIAEELAMMKARMQ